jgi:hypothetical protein
MRGKYFYESLHPAARVKIKFAKVFERNLRATDGAGHNPLDRK